MEGRKGKGKEGEGRGGEGPATLTILEPSEVDVRGTSRHAQLLIVFNDVDSHQKPVDSRKRSTPAHDRSSSFAPV